MPPAEKESGGSDETQETPLLETPRRGRRPGFKPKLSAETRERLSQKMKDRQARLAVLRREAEIRKRLHTARKELAWRKKHESIRYYCVKHDGEARGAHKKQVQFHSSKAHIRIASGANRSGKSTSGINEDVAYALGYRPWLKPEDPDYKVPVRVPNKGLICGESFQEQVKKVLIPKLLGDPEKGVPGAIPTEEVADTKKNPQGIITYIRLRNGSEIFLQSYDQAVDLFESADYDWVHFDEPPPRPIWIAVQRGLTDREAPCWITMTPLKEPWLYDEVYNREDAEVFYFDIEDNLNYGLTRRGIDQFAAGLTDDEKEARLRGRFFHLTGLVYKTYGPVHKLARAKVIPAGVPRHWSHWMHIDCHPRKAHHAVWISIAPTRKKYIVGELKNHDMLNRIEPFCEAMKVYEMTVLKLPMDRIHRLIDPISGTPDPAREGLSMWDEFDRCGYPCKPGSKNRDAGILLFQNELKHDPAQGSYPGMYVMDDLTGVDHELRHYIWEEHQNKKAAERLDEKQVPRKKFDDYIEGIHRILLDGADYEELEQDDEESDPEQTAATGANPFTNY